MSTAPASPQPLVTALINNFNYSRYLADAIDSALAQTYPHVEVVIVDDGSTDDSREVIERYGGRVRPVIKSNGGQGSAFNAGFSVSRGELIALLDADDRWAADKIEKAVAAAAAEPEAGLIIHRVQRVDVEGRPVKAPGPAKLMSGDLRNWVRRWGCWPQPPTSGLTLRRSFLEQVMPMPEPAYRGHADTYLAVMAGLLTTVAAVPEVLARLLIHGDNLAFGEAEAARRQLASKHLAFIEGHEEAIQQVLAERFPGIELSLDNDFRYQTLCRRAGRNVSLAHLMKLGLTKPDEPSLPRRVKVVAKNLSRWLSRDLRNLTPPVLSTAQEGEACVF
ncbi:MAG: glycosyltransferase family A protein [Planctomycetota bacterium]